MLGEDMRWDTPAQQVVYQALEAPTSLRTCKLLSLRSPTKLIKLSLRTGRGYEPWSTMCIQCHDIVTINY